MTSFIIYQAIRLTNAKVVPFNNGIKLPTSFFMPNRFDLNDHLIIKHALKKIRPIDQLAEAKVLDKDIRHELSVTQLNNPFYIIYCESDHNAHAVQQQLVSKGRAGIVFCTSLASKSSIEAVDLLPLKEISIHHLFYALTMLPNSVNEVAVFTHWDPSLINELDKCSQPEVLLLKSTDINGE